MSVTLSVDVMGGDVGVAVTVPAALRFLRDNHDTHLILVGDESAINKALRSASFLNHERLEICHASEVVGMDEMPQLALKNKKQSSLRIAIDLVKEGRAEAAVSAGNTGALMATAHFVLKMLPGIDRPAIAKLLPGQHGPTCALDLGANIDATPEQLLQFAVMGAELMHAIQGVDRPSVGLLNMGTESTKGRDVVQQAHELIKQSDLNYAGYIEGNDLFSGKVSVVVTDGFTGNVALKAAEGVARMITDILRDELTQTIWRRCCALASTTALKAIRARLDARRYNGASLLGLRGIVVKSHGGADEKGFYFALAQAYEEVHQQVVKYIAQHIDQTSSTAIQSQ